MKIYRHPVIKNPHSSRVIISRTEDKKWLIVRGSNWTLLPADTFTDSPRNWTYALWTGYAWANEEYQQELAHEQAEAMWQLQHA